MLNAALLTYLAQFLSNPEALFVASTNKFARRSLSWLRELLVASIVDKNKHSALNDGL